MTDAISAIARDQARATAFERYLISICEWAEGDFNADGRNKVTETANDHDLIQGGYWGSGTAITSRIEQRLDALQTGDQVTWGRLLAFADDVWKGDIKIRLQAASPFGRELISFVSYGMGFVKTPAGALMQMLSDSINAAGYDVEAGQEYLITLPEDAFKGITIVQLHKGYN